MYSKVCRQRWYFKARKVHRPRKGWKKVKTSVEEVIRRRKFTLKWSDMLSGHCWLAVPPKVSKIIDLTSECVCLNCFVLCWISSSLDTDFVNEGLEGAISLFSSQMMLTAREPRRNCDDRHALPRRQRLDGRAVEGVSCRGTPRRKHITSANPLD